MKKAALALLAMSAAYLIAVPRAVLAQEIPPGTLVAVRTADAIDSRNADLSREYAAGLDSPLAVNGVLLAPRGAEAILRVVETQQAGIVTGRASLTLRLVGLVIDGARVAVESSEVTSESSSQGARATKGGVLGGAVGSVIGGVLGGAGGAAKGAAAGAAAGIGVAAVSGQRVQVPSETRLTFTLARAASLKPAGTPPATGAGASVAASPPSADSAVHSQVRLEVMSATGQGNSLTISLTAFNEGPDRPIIILPAGSQIVDDGGNSYRAARVTIGNQESQSELVSGTRTNIVLTFNDLAVAGNFVQANRVARLRLRVQVGPEQPGQAQGGTDIDFRNIPIRKN
jgi:hypothetical protein